MSTGTALDITRENNFCPASTNMAKERVRIRVDGRVQGVFFRASARDEAVKLGLSGWVRNNPDGSVEILAEGEGEKLDELMGWCRKGPLDARVDELDASREKCLSEFDRFYIKYD